MVVGLVNVVGQKMGKQVLIGSGRGLLDCEFGWMLLVWRWSCEWVKISRAVTPEKPLTRHEILNGNIKRIKFGSAIILDRLELWTVPIGPDLGSKTQTVGLGKTVGPGLAIGPMVPTGPRRAVVLPGLDKRDELVRNKSPVAKWGEHVVGPGHEVSRLVPMGCSKLGSTTALLGPVGTIGPIAKPGPTVLPSPTVWVFEPRSGPIGTVHSSNRSSYDVTSCIYDRYTPRSCSGGLEHGYRPSKKCFERVKAQRAYGALRRGAYQSAGFMNTIPRPPDTNIVRCMWRFLHKYLTDDTLSRYKARLVVNGSTQLQGVDVDETFSPVVKPGIIRTVLNLAAFRHWPIHQLDVKNAFLHGDLSERLFICISLLDFRILFIMIMCVCYNGLSMSLNRAPELGFSGLHLILLRDCCSRLLDRQGTNTAYLLLYLMILFSQLLFRDCISVTRDSLGLFLYQKKYAIEILDRAHMDNCNPRCDGDLVSDPTLYRSRAALSPSLGLLRGVEVTPRTFARPLRRHGAPFRTMLYMHDSWEPHFSSLKQIMWSRLAPLRRHGAPFRTMLYMHDPWEPHFSSLKQIMWYVHGYYVFLGNNLLSWSTKGQPMLSRSSAEAEYRGVSNVAAETCWLCNLLRELHTPLSS
nr:hypothetical protein [Tanacetum cinerariifolium]